MYAGTDELQAFLEQYPDTEYLDALFIDICGMPRGKRLPKSDFEKAFKGGVQIPFSVYLLDAAGETADPCGLGYGDGDPDGPCRPRTNTLVPVPWAQRPRGQVIMAMFDEQGEPYANDPRNVAAGVLNSFLERSLNPMVAFELEFYLIDPKRTASGGPQTLIDASSGQRAADTQVYGIDQLDACQPLLSEIVSACETQDVPASVITKEFAPGQFEVNLHHVDNALLAADHAVLLRNVIKNVARNHGAEASFMSKPFPGTSGSGMHLHVSLVDDSGSNIFSADNPLENTPLRHAVGGLRDTMFEAFSLFAPNVNALRRFCPNIYVPVAPSWGVNNRSLAFRIPRGESKATRVEHRIAGADANPYLVLAAVLAGMLHGLDNKIDPGPPSTGNAGLECDPRLPRHMWQALDLTEGSEILGRHMGAQYLKLYCETKRAELDHFYSLPTAVEYRWYL